MSALAAPSPERSAQSPIPGAVHLRHREPCEWDRPQRGWTSVATFSPAQTGPEDGTVLPPSYGGATQLCVRLGTNKIVATDLATVDESEDCEPHSRHQLERAARPVARPNHLVSRRVQITGEQVSPSARHRVAIRQVPRPVGGLPRAAYYFPIHFGKLRWNSGRRTSPRPATKRSFTHRDLSIEDLLSGGDGPDRLQDRNPSPARVCALVSGDHRITGLDRVGSGVARQQHGASGRVVSPAAWGHLRVSFASSMGPRFRQ
jgi:hypothetical protein